MTADISDTYEFPHHTIPTDLQPDLVWWDEAHKSITLVELTVCFKPTSKRQLGAKYLHLVEQAKARGYRSELSHSRLALVRSSTFLDLRT